jgi:hypothetical protein
MIQTHYSKYLHETTLENAVSEMAEALDSGIDAMKDFSEERAEHPRAAGKWTPKELLGHLIDSAVNNHQRFVRAQILAHLKNGVLEIDGYEQNDWVSVNHYATRDWGELLELWDAMNTQILHVMDNVDSSKLQTHVKISGNDPITLEALMVDYVGHLKHHLAQLLEQ